MLQYRTNLIHGTLNQQFLGVVLHHLLNNLLLQALITGTRSSHNLLQLKLKPKLRKCLAHIGSNRLSAH